MSVLVASLKGLIGIGSGWFYWAVQGRSAMVFNGMSPLDLAVYGDGGVPLDAWLWFSPPAFVRSFALL